MVLGESIISCIDRVGKANSEAPKTNSQVFATVMYSNPWAYAALFS